MWLGEFDSWYNGANIRLEYIGNHVFSKWKELIIHNKKKKKLKKMEGTEMNKPEEEKNEEQSKDRKTSRRQENSSTGANLGGYIYRAGSPSIFELNAC